MNFSSFTSSCTQTILSSSCLTPSPKNSSLLPVTHTDSKSTSMDNAAFRSLMSSAQNNNTDATSVRKSTSLGSKARPPLSMAPRNVLSPGYNQKGEFAPRYTENTSGREPPLKKFKSSTAPKGTKLRAGYVDRTQLRKDQEKEIVNGEDRVLRLKNLEEQFKLGQINQVQFQQLRDQIGVGGDVESTHLVKGLDWKLLERVRRGEHIDQAKQDAENPSEIDVDEELEHALRKEVVASKKEKAEPDVEVDQRHQNPLSRDEILRQFREQREGPKAASVVPPLTKKFKKVAAPERPSRKKHIESVNGRKREVLIITNRDGTTKRKTRWIDPVDIKPLTQEPLGMDVPVEIAAKQRAFLEAEANEDHNEDIFADVGADYDPLAGIQSGSDEDSEAQEEQAKINVPTNATQRNYFSTDTTVDNEDTNNATINDPTILVALRRAAKIRQRDEAVNGESDGLRADQAKSSAILAKLKEQERQDAADFDYGFGESRFSDDDNDEAGPLYEDGSGDKEKGRRRKRGPKKRNKEDLQEVMSVVEKRRKS